VPWRSVVSRTILARQTCFCGIGDNCLQRAAVGVVHCNVGSFVHSSDSHSRVRGGIRKRIESPPGRSFDIWTLRFLFGQFALVTAPNLTPGYH
jgi:hypothetical protein